MQPTVLSEGPSRRLIWRCLLALLCVIAAFVPTFLLQRLFPYPLGVELLEWLRIDDPIGAVPVHGFCGIWGTLSLGPFACGQYGATGPVSPDNSAPLRGLFYGGGLQVLKAQIIGSAAITVAMFAVAMVVMLAFNALGMLRLPAEDEMYGMDLHEHGISPIPST